MPARLELPAHLRNVFTAESRIFFSWGGGLVPINFDFEFKMRSLVIRGAAIIFVSRAWVAVSLFVQALCNDVNFGSISDGRRRRLTNCLVE